LDRALSKGIKISTSWSNIPGVDEIVTVQPMTDLSQTEFDFVPISKEKKCDHKFVNLFTSCKCEYCGVDKK
jgi:hypothetical protein